MALKTIQTSRGERTVTAGSSDDPSSKKYKAPTKTRTTTPSRSSSSSGSSRSRSSRSSTPSKPTSEPRVYYSSVPGWRPKDASAVVIYHKDGQATGQVSRKAGTTENVSSLRNVDISTSSRRSSKTRSSVASSVASVVGDYRKKQSIAEQKSSAPKFDAQQQRWLYTDKDTGVKTYRTPAQQVTDKKLAAIEIQKKKAQQPEYASMLRKTTPTKKIDALSYGTSGLVGASIISKAKTALPIQTTKSKLTGMSAITGMGVATTQTDKPSFFSKIGGMFKKKDVRPYTVEQVGVKTTDRDISKVDPHKAFLIKKNQGVLTEVDVDKYLNNPEVVDMKTHLEAGQYTLGGKPQTKSEITRVNANYNLYQDALKIKADNIKKRASSVGQVYTNEINEANIQKQKVITIEEQMIGTKGRVDYLQNEYQKNPTPQLLNELTSANAKHSKNPVFAKEFITDADVKNVEYEYSKLDKEVKDVDRVVLSNKKIQQQFANLQDKQQRSNMEYKSVIGDIEDADKFKLVKKYHEDVLDTSTSFGTRTKARIGQTGAFVAGIGHDIVQVPRAAGALATGHKEEVKWIDTAAGIVSLTGLGAATKMPGVRTLAKRAAISVGASVVGVEATKKGSQLLAPIEQKEIIKGTGFRKVMRESLAEERGKVAEKGLIKSFLYEVPTGKIWGGEKKQFQESAREKFYTQGYRGAQLDTAVKAATRQRFASGAGEAAGILAANVGSEIWGSKMLSTAAKTTTGGVGALRTAAEIGKAGMIEGLAIEGVKASSEYRTLDPTRTVLSAGAGYVTAGAIGGLMGGGAARKAGRSWWTGKTLPKSTLSKTGTKAATRTGTAAKWAVYVTDPYEALGDIAASPFTKVRARPTTLTPAFSTTQTLASQSNIGTLAQPSIVGIQPMSMTGVKTSALTPSAPMVRTPASVDSMSNIFAQTQPMSQPLTGVMTPTAVQTQTTINTQAAVQTDVMTNVPTQTFTPTQTQPFTQSAVKTGMGAGLGAVPGGFGTGRYGRGVAGWSVDNTIWTPEEWFAKDKLKSNSFINSKQLTAKQKIKQMIG